MLVLSRKPGESIQIGDDVELTVLEVKGNRIRLGIRADHNTRIVRSELLLNVDSTKAELTAEEPSPQPSLQFA